MRLSRYLIATELTRGSGALCHGLTGSVDIVDARLWAWIAASRQSGDICSAELQPATWDRLRQRGYVVSDDHDEREVVHRLGAVRQARNCRPSGFFLIPTYSCQLRCPYCCQSGRRTARRAENTRTIDEPTIDAAFRAMRAIAGGTVRSLNLYGGEPLLTENHSVIARIVARAVDEGYDRLAVVTNGVEADRFVDLMGQNGIRGVCISLDGPPAVHDRRRALGTRKNCGTFARIMANIPPILDTGARVAIRLNVDASNLQSVAGCIDVLMQQPWAGAAEVTYNICPIYSPPGTSFAVAVVDPQAYVRYVAALERERQVLPRLECDLAIGRQVGEIVDGRGFQPLHPRHPAYCGGTEGIYLFDATGAVYTCVDAVNDSACAVGRYYPEFRLDEKAVARESRWTAEERERCLDCPYVMLCGGGCRHRWDPASDRSDARLCRQIEVGFAAELRDRLARMAGGRPPKTYSAWL